MCSHILTFNLQHLIEVYTNYLLDGFPMLTSNYYRLVKYNLYQVFHLPHSNWKNEMENITSTPS